MNSGCEVLNAAAAGGVSGTWNVIEACGGPSRPSELLSYRLPTQPARGVKSGWPIFHSNPTHRGS